MSGLAGDLRQVTVKHPTLGSHTFLPKSNESVNRDPGGLRTNDDANQVTAGGLITQLNLVRASFEMTVSNDENIREDAEFAKSLTGSPTDGEWTMEHASGAIWGMTGRPVGDIIPDLNAGTFTLKVAGVNMRKVAG